MHPRLAEVMSYAEEARAELLVALADIDPVRAARHPDAGGWSVAEVVEHLHLVEHSSLRALFRALRNARAAGLGDEADDASLAPLIADVASRIGAGGRTAPDFTRPKSAEPLPELVARLAESREGLRTWAREADGAALQEAYFPHPALGELSLYGWVAMLGAHERHHTAQLRAIDAALGD